LYIYNGSKSIDSKVLDAVRLWEFLRQGNRLDMDQVRLVYSHMLVNTQIKYGHKTMPDGTEGTFYGLQELKNHHGLMHSLPWDQGLGKISERDKTYIKACLRKGESLTKTPRIRISTIHSAKGAQATNVMLLTDTMRRPYSMWRKINSSYEDDESRVFYVGLTRATNCLHLVHPMFSQGFSLSS
jgi:superfamily I DNA/RNA helicase